MKTDGIAERCVVKS